MNTEEEIQVIKQFLAWAEEVHNAGLFKAYQYPAKLDRLDSDQLLFFYKTYRELVG